MKFLENILARLFAGFKTKNPLLYLVIISALVGFKVFLDEGNFLGDNEEKYAEWVVFILAVLGGTHTTEILNKDKEPKE